MAELIAEVGFGLVSVAVGLVLGSVVFVLLRSGRWVLLRSERATPVTAPDGRRWMVRIPLAPTPVRFRASRTMLRMRTTDQRRRQTVGASPDGVLGSELAHPRRLLDEMDEAASIVAVFMLAFVLLAVVVLFMEAVVVVVAAAVVALVRLVRGRWQCEVIGPDGGRMRLGSGSLAAARAHRTQICESIERRGSVPELTG